MIRARGKGKLTTRYSLAVRPRKRAGSTWRCATLDSESSRLKSLDGDWQVPDGPLGLSSELGERDCDRFGPRESFLTSHECRFDSIRPVGFHANRFPSQLITSIRGRNLSTFVDDRWRERGYINSMEKYHLYRRDIYIWRLRRRIDEFSLDFGDGGERERDSRNVCILERGFHINCFTKSVHKVWCNVILFYALSDDIYTWWNMQRKLKAFELYGDSGAMFWSRVKRRQERKSVIGNEIFCDEKRGI